MADSQSSAGAKTFSALRRVRNLKRSKMTDIAEMPFFIVHVPNDPLGQRFKIRKRSCIAKWNAAIANSTMLKRGLTDGERATDFARGGNVRERFRIFAATRKATLKSLCTLGHVFKVKRYFGPWVTIACSMLTCNAILQLLCPLTSRGILSWT